MVSGPLEKPTLSLDKHEYDDDGRVKRTGTFLTASSHIITAVIGSGVLSLAWATAQLGWIAGPLSLLIFALITWYTSCLLADCYRHPGPLEGTRTYTYIGAVKAHLGGFMYKLCGVSQYANLIGASTGYTITSAISMAAIKRSNCFHKRGHQVKCRTTNNAFMITFGVAEIILSQVPNFHKLTGLSIIAAAMSFSYSLIGVGLSAAKVWEGGDVRTSLTGVEVGLDVTRSEKIWNCLQALGNIAFAYTYSVVLVEIQDTLRSSPPEIQESKVMKKASLFGVSITTLFYVLCGTVGYAAFGNNAPGNFLTGFGFYEPYLLVDFANLCIVIHLVGAYQVFSQPTFQLVEDSCRSAWPESAFVTREYPIRIPCFGVFRLNALRLLWRTAYVIVITLVAMIFPFFNSVLGLIGAISYWPLSVYFPIEMYIAQAKIPRYSLKGLWLRGLALICFLVSVLAVVASVQGIVVSIKTFHIFSAASGS